MKLKVSVLTAILLAGLLPGAAHSMHISSPGKNVTPYGSYCNRISHYGIHHDMLSDKQVEESLGHYYGEKGLTYEIIKYKGRFVEALVKDGDQIVDKIILDRGTGRIRSIY